MLLLLTRVHSFRRPRWISSRASGIWV